MSGCNIFTAFPSGSLKVLLLSHVCTSPPILCSAEIINSDRARTNSLIKATYKSKLTSKQGV